MDEPLVNIVCTANICRSPMAAALLADALRHEPPPLGSLRVVSSGVMAAPGLKASANSVEVLRRRGMDLSAHRSRTVDLALAFDAILHLCMTRSHAATLLMAYPELKPRVRLWRSFIPGISPADADIPDPYGGSLQLYEDCCASMAEAVPYIVAHLRSLKSFQTK